MKVHEVLDRVLNQMRRLDVLNDSCSALTKVTARVVAAERPEEKPSRSDYAEVLASIKFPCC